MKNKILFSFIFIIFTGFSAYSQDTIRMVDRSVIICEIIKYTPNKVYYNIFNDNTSESLIVHRKDVKKILFENDNGKYDLYEDASLLGKPIETKKAMVGPDLYIGDKKLSKFELESIMSHYPEILDKYQKGKQLQILGVVITTPTAVFTAGSIIFSTTANKANLTAVAIGAAGLVVGITIITRGKEKINNAIGEYNGMVTERSKLSVDFGFQKHGIGIGISF